ncbi:MAG: hypothetical protein PVH88_16620 [Ignavibacteria bacterium]|jgi:hypothetical protein
MRRLLLLAAILIIVLQTNYSAQTIGGSIMLAVPQGEFKENVDNLGYGLQVQGTLTTPGRLTPFTVGLNLSYMIYGQEERTAPLSTTVPDVTVDVERKNSIVNFHFLFQVSPFAGTVKPYLEGLAGGQYIFTESSVKGDNNYEDFASSTNYDDFTWSMGVGGGFLITLTKATTGIPGGLFLDLKARYMYGGEAEYLTEGDVIVNNGSVIYRTRKSETDFLSFHIGVVAAF